MAEFGTTNDTLPLIFLLMQHILKIYFYLNIAWFAMFLHSTLGHFNLTKNIKITGEGGLEAWWFATCHKTLA